MTPGTLIGKYRLVRRLGRGAMGEVWEAVNIDTDRRVALKLITSPDPELRRRLLREARAIGRLDHPNIVQILDRGETPQGEPFLVMQLLQGETLQDRLRREITLPESIAAGIALDIARALRVAHENEIIHRDLKPANIFLHREPDTDDDVIKVVDFGVSKVQIENEGASTVQGGLLGSPAYMSPEQIRSSGVDGRADVWALGVILYEMLGGRRPFEGPNAVAVLGQILNPDHIPRIEAIAPRVNRGLAVIVSACLDRDLDKRVGSVAELGQMLRPFATRGRHATVERAALRSAPAIPRPPPSTPEIREERDSDVVETNLFRPSHLVQAALASPAPQAGTGTVLISGPPRSAAPMAPRAPDESRDSTTTFWQPGMASGAGGAPADESERITTAVMQPAAPRPAPPRPAPPRPPPPAPPPPAPAFDSGSWPRPGAPAPSSFAPASGAWSSPAAVQTAPVPPPAPASQPRQPSAPDLSQPPVVERAPRWRSTQPLEVRSLPAPPAPPAPDMYGGTIKVEPGMIAVSPAALHNLPPPAPPAPGVTTTNAPFATSNPLPLVLPPAVSPEPRRWPIVLLIMSIAALAAVVAMLVVTLREDKAKPASPVPAAAALASTSASAPKPAAPGRR